MRCAGGLKKARPVLAVCALPVVHKNIRGESACLLLQTCRLCRLLATAGGPTATREVGCEVRRVVCLLATGAAVPRQVLWRTFAACSEIHRYY